MTTQTMTSPLDQIQSLRPIDIPGPTYDYVTDPSHGVGIAIAREQAQSGGIITLTRTGAAAGAGYADDRDGERVYVDAHLPSEFDALRERLPDAVSDLVDLLVLHEPDEWAVVVVLGPSGAAEYGAFSLQRLRAGDTD